MHSDVLFYLASDHAGYIKKQFIYRLLQKHGYPVKDLGPTELTPVDYPDYAQRMAKEMEHYPNSKGILLCGTGIGISIAANRFAHIRAALCTSQSQVILARAHNDANVLVLPARCSTKAQIRHYLRLFIKTSFEGGRHTLRVAKLNTLTE